MRTITDNTTLADIITEDGSLNLDMESDFYRLNMKQRLDTVKKHPSGSDTFVCPANLKNEICLFLNAYLIPYSSTEKPVGVQPDEIERQMNRYLTIDTFENKPSILDTPFENDALFEWSKQLFGKTKDPEYKKYKLNIHRLITQYYNEYYDESDD